MRGNIRGRGTNTGRAAPARDRGRAAA